MAGQLTDRRLTLDLSVDGMRCGSCAARIQKTLAKQPGVAEAIRAVRRIADGVAAAGFAILLVLSFARTADAAPQAATPIWRAGQSTTTDSASGSVVFALSIVAVLVIGAIVAWKTRSNRPW